jgi:diamine N-acetyltransferase
MAFVFSKSMNQTLEIVKATAADAELIVSLARKTFVDTYSELGIRNNMGRYMEEYFNVEKLADELAREDLHFYLAKLKDEAVGFTKLRNDRLPKGIVDKKCLEIERIYILKEHQGNSGGKELMNVIKKMARESLYQVIWLQIWMKNEKAVQFYRKSGFVVYETTVFNFYDELHQDYLLRYDLYI